MAIRLHEVHPSIVHFPIALLPASLAADALGRLTGGRSLLAMGRWAIALTAGAAALAGLTGLIAQEEVKAEGEARDILITHRNLNVAFLGLATSLAVQRRTQQPSCGYLTAGLISLATVVHSAYLRGKMVYEHGVGVKPAGGLRAGHAPELRRGQAREMTLHALRDAGLGVRHAAEDLRGGHLAPTIIGPTETVH